MTALTALHFIPNTVTQSQDTHKEESLPNAQQRETGFVRRDGEFHLVVVILVKQLPACQSLKAPEKNLSGSWVLLSNLTSQELTHFGVFLLTVLLYLRQVKAAKGHTTTRRKSVARLPESDIWQRIQHAKRVTLPQGISVVLQKRGLGSRRGRGWRESSCYQSKVLSPTVSLLSAPNPALATATARSAAVQVTSNRCNTADVSVHTVRERFVFSPSKGMKCVTLLPLLTFFHTAELVSLDTI